jgi:hypothetical protein
MSRVVFWKAWYKDGKAYGRHDCKPSALPQDGFLGMILGFDDGTGRYISGNEYYFFPDDDTFGQTDKTEDILRLISWVKFGRTATETEMAQVNKAMVEELAEWRKTITATKDLKGCCK